MSMPSLRPRLLIWAGSEQIRSTANVCGVGPGRADYSAVVVTFRRPDSLHAVLSSLATQTSRPNMVVVADNDPLRSARAVVHRWSEAVDVSVHYLPMDENLGPAGGWARAAAWASDRLDRGDWLLVVDDDDPLGNNELVQRLLQAVDDVADPVTCGAIGLRGAVLHRRSALLTRCEPREGTSARVDYLASGGVPLYRWTMIDQQGFFDERLFFGFEDLDQGLRMTSGGWNLWTAPMPSLYDVPDTATARRPWREYYKSRALVFIMRHRVGPIALLATILRTTMGSLRLLFRKRQRSLASARLHGAWDALRGHMGPAGWDPAANEAKSQTRRGET